MFFRGINLSDKVVFLWLSDQRWLKFAEVWRNGLARKTYFNFQLPFVFCRTQVVLELWIINCGWWLTAHRLLDYTESSTFYSTADGGFHHCCFSCKYHSKVIKVWKWSCILYFLLQLFEIPFLSISQETLQKWLSLFIKIFLLGSMHFGVCLGKDEDSIHHRWPEAVQCTALSFYCDGFFVCLGSN